MLRGFKNFLMRGDVIVVAVGLVVALAFSGLILAFTTDIISPIVARFQGGGGGPGCPARHAGNPKTFIDFGSFISSDHLFHHFHRRGLLPHRGAL